MALILYGGIYTSLATTGLMLVRSRLESANLAESLGDPGVYLGILCYAASFGTFLLALRRFDVLTVFPLFTGITYAAVAVAAAVVLGEDLSAARLAGLGLVGAGAILLVR